MGGEIALTEQKRRNMNDILCIHWNSFVTFVALINERKTPKK